MADTVTSTPLSTGVVPAAASGVSPYTSTSTISPYAQGYVSDMLSTAQILADKPYTPYTGQLVAGPSALQTQAFQGIGALTMPTSGYTAMQYGAPSTAPTPATTAQMPADMRIYADEFPTAQNISPELLRAYESGQYTSPSGLPAALEQALMRPRSAFSSVPTPSISPASTSGFGGAFDDWAKYSTTPKEFGTAGMPASTTTQPLRRPRSAFSTVPPLSTSYGAKYSTTPKEFGTAGTPTSTTAQPAVTAAAQPSYQYGNQFTAPTQTAATQFEGQFRAPDVGRATQFGQYYNAPPQTQATQFTNQFAGPAQTQATKFGDLYNAPDIGTATQFTNQFQGPAGGAYAPTEFDTDTWTAQQAQQYMNPYLQSALSPQLTAARREAEAKRVADAARLTQAGAYGGSRQAIMESEGARNLAENLANITGAGYRGAYDTALQQWNVEQGRGLEAQKATEASKQFGAQQAMTAAQLQAQYGLSAQQAQEAARQFQVQQGMTAAEREAQYGLSSLQSTESARQFQSQQAMTAAQLQAQYGLSAQQAQEAARQFQSQQGMTAAQLQAQYGLSADQSQEAARQFGVQTTADLAKFGATFGLDAQRAQEAARQFQSQQAMTAAQSTAQYGLAGLQAAEASRQFAAKYGLEALQAGQNLAQARLTMGATQRDITQQDLASKYQQWQNAQKYPYEQLQFQQSMLEGLPITTQQITRPELSAPEKAMAAANQLQTAFNWAKAAGIVGKEDTLMSVLKSGWNWLMNSSGANVTEANRVDVGGVVTDLLNTGAIPAEQAMKILESYGIKGSAVDDYVPTYAWINSAVDNSDLADVYTPDYTEGGDNTEYEQWKNYYLSLFDEETA